MNKLYLALSLLVAAPAVFAAGQAKQEEAPKAPVIWTEAQAAHSKEKAEIGQALDTRNDMFLAFIKAQLVVAKANQALAANPEDAELKAKVEVANNALEAVIEECAKVDAAYADYYTGIFKKAAAAIVAVSAIVAYKKFVAIFQLTKKISLRNLF